MLVPMILLCLGTSLSAADSGQAASYPTKNPSNVNIETSKNSSNYSAQEPSSYVIQPISKKELNSYVRDVNNSNVNPAYKVLPVLGAPEASSSTRKGTSLPTADFSQTKSSIKDSSYNSNPAQDSSSSQIDSEPLKDIDLHSISDSISKNKTFKMSGIVARKGTPMEPSDEGIVSTQSEILSTSESTLKLKPTTIGTEQVDSKDSTYYSKTSLIVGLSFGILLLLALAYVAFWRLHEFWTKRQYKRVDFLVDGLYIDT